MLVNECLEILKVFEADFEMQLAIPEDLDEILEMYMEKDTFKYIPVMQDLSRLDYIEFYLKRLEDIKLKKGFYWIIRASETNDFIGAINLTPLANGTQMQIGWQIVTKYRRKGYALKASKTILRLAFKQLKLQEVYGIYQEENLASKHMFDKLEFKQIRSYYRNGRKYIKTVKRAQYI